MSDWKPKRFWKTATPTTTENGFTVLLDTRTVRTPAKAPLTVPTMAMAEAIAAEWVAQEELLDPGTMPVTRGANAAIDKISTQREEVVALLAEYGDSDLLCYRAAGPEALISKQAEGWDPVLDWAAQSLDARLFVGEGVMHVPQTRQTLQNLRAEFDAFSDFELAAAHDLIAISGSLVLALAVTKGALSADQAWTLSRIDEDWQISQWGEDDEATKSALVKQTAFLDAFAFYQLCQD